MTVTESDFKLIIKVMGGNLVSTQPDVYAVWTRGCRDPTRYLFTYVSGIADNEEKIFKNIRLKFSHDIHVIVTEKSVFVNSKVYNIESGDKPDLDVVRLFMELIRKRENFK